MNGLGVPVETFPLNSAQQPCHPEAPSPSGVARVWHRGKDRVACCQVCVSGYWYLHDIELHGRFHQTIHGINMGVSWRKAYKAEVEGCQPQGKGHKEDRGLGGEGLFMYSNTVRCTNTSCCAAVAVRGIPGSCPQHLVWYGIVWYRMVWVG